MKLQNLRTKSFKATKCCVNKMKYEYVQIYLFGQYLLCHDIYYYYTLYFYDDKHNVYCQRANPCSCPSAASSDCLVVAERKDIKLFGTGKMSFQALWTCNYKTYAIEQALTDLSDNTFCKLTSTMSYCFVSQKPFELFFSFFSFLLPAQMLLIVYISVLLE